MYNRRTNHGESNGLTSHSNNLHSPSAITAMHHSVHQAPEPEFSPPGHHTADADATRAMLAAVKAHDTKILQHYLGNLQCSANTSDPDDCTLLHWSVWLKFADLVQLLLQHGANINAVNVRKESVLEWAIRGNDSSILKMLLTAADPHLDTVNALQGTLLHVAAEEGNVPLIQCLLLVGLSINAQDQMGYTALHNAIQRKHQGAASVLLLHHADPLLLADNYTTTLHLAAAWGNAKLIGDLLHRGARPHLSLHGTKQNVLPEQVAHQLGFSHVARMLKDRRLTYNSWWRQYFTVQADDQKSAASTSRRTPSKQLFSVPQLYYYATLTGTLLHFMYSGEQDEVLQFDTSLELRVMIIVMYLSALVSMIGFGVVSQRDPGSIPYGSANHDTSYLINATLDGNAVCITCKIVKPLRSKHDAFTNTCVREFDHFCPWTNNSIGCNNHRVFIVALLAFITAAISYIILAAYYLVLPVNADRPMSEYKLPLAILIHCACIMFGCLILVISQLVGISKVLTTNETVNRERYSYLVDNNGQSPYDQGSWWSNCLVFWRCRRRTVDVDEYTPWRTVAASYSIQRTHGAQRRVFGNGNNSNVKYMPVSNGDDSIAVENDAAATDGSAASAMQSLAKMV